MFTKNQKKLFVVVFGLFFSQLAVSAGNGQTNDIWQVIHVEGQSQTKSSENITKSHDWRNLSLGENLPAPAYIRTGQDSRIILKHRNDKITIASNSLLKLEKEKYSEEGILTKIIQTIGYSLFNIEKNSERKNIIETPYLVSVVKGTTFTVQVSKSRSIVNLLEGKLQVNAAQFNSSTIINTGQIAQLAKGDRSITVLDASKQVSPQSRINNQPVKNSNSNTAEITSLDTGTSAIESTTNIDTSSPNSVPDAINSVVSDTVLISNGVSNITLPDTTGTGVGGTPSGNNGIGIGVGGTSNGIGIGVGGTPPGNGGTPPGLNK